MNKIYEKCFRSLVIALLCCGNKQLQKSQWLNKVDVYFLFILHVPCRARAVLLGLISTFPDWPRIHSAKCFRTTEIAGGGRGTNCALAFNCFLTEMAMAHATSALVKEKLMATSTLNRMHMYKHCMWLKVKNDKNFMKSINDSQVHIAGTKYLSRSPSLSRHWP